MKVYHFGRHKLLLPFRSLTTLPVTQHICTNPDRVNPSCLPEHGSRRMEGASTCLDALDSPVVGQFAIKAQFCFPENRPFREDARKTPTCRRPTPWQGHPLPFAPPPARHLRSGICSYRFSSLLSWRVGPVSARLAREASIGWRKTSYPVRQSISTSRHLLCDRLLCHNDIAARDIIN